MLDRLLHRMEGVARVAVWIGGAMLIFAAFMVTFDVLARKFFNWSMAGADEITGYLFAVSTAWAYAFCLLGRTNVRIDALYQHLPVRLCAFLDIVSLLVMGVFMTFLTYFAFQVFKGSLGWPFGETDFWSVSITPMLTPLAIPQGFWLLGLLQFLLTLALVLTRAVTAFVRGDLAAVAEVAGSRTHREEVEDELQTAETHRAESTLEDQADRD